MMDLKVFHNLLSEEGHSILTYLSQSDLNEENTLKFITNLRKEYPRELVEAAVETALLRKRAEVKFSKAGEMYFTREALEQASGEIISTYRAERYSEFAKVVDLACGIGGDTIPLAKSSRVVAVDKDPLRLAMARLNAAVYGVSERIEFVEADINEFDVSAADAVFFDPARRSGGRRIFSVSDYSPPLSVIERWLDKVPAAGVKISPGMDYEEIKWDCEIEFISVGGELKEAVLWFGPFKTTERRATLLPSRDTLVGDERINIPVTGPLDYLYEPDAAVIRSHLVGLLAAKIGANKIDPDIAFLTSDEALDTPFARRFRVEDVMPFNVKRLNERLRFLDVGRVVVKKRGSPILPEELQKKLKLSGSREIIVVLTHLDGKPGIILCTPD